MAATGFAWTAGSFADVALFLHRGPLVHLLLGYPRGRLRSRLEQVVVGAVYVDAAIWPGAWLPVSVGGGGRRTGR
jgi:hypothetical protein